MRTIPYAIKLSLLGALLFPCFGRLALHGTGNETDIYRYLIPLIIGSTSGCLVGILLDKLFRTMQKLKETNTTLASEITAHRQSEARYAALFEKNHAVILLIDPENGKVIDANPSASTFYGYTLHQLRSMNISQINTLSQEAILREMALAKKEHRKQYFFRHRLASGEIRDVEVYSGIITFNDSTYLLSVIHDLTELKQLRGIIPICASCKQIRDDQGYWNRLEAYITEHSQAAFSHSICPACMATQYTDFFVEEEQPTSERKRL